MLLFRQRNRRPAGDPGGIRKPVSRDAYSLLHCTSLPSVRPCCCVNVVLKLHSLHHSPVGSVSITTRVEPYVDNSHQVWSWYDNTLPSYSVFVCWYVTWLCDLDFWPFDLEQLLCMAGYVNILATKFEDRTPISSWFMSHKSRTDRRTVFKLGSLFVLLTYKVYHTRGPHVDNSHQVWSWYVHTLPSYSVFVCWYVMWQCDLDMWTFQLEQLQCMAGHVVNLATKLEDPVPIRSWFMWYNISHWLPLKMRTRPLRMRRTTWPVSRGSKQLHFWNRRPIFAYSLCNFNGSTMKVIKVICKNIARPGLKDAWVSAHARNHVMCWRCFKRLIAVVLVDVDLPYCTSKVKHIVAFTAIFINICTAHAQKRLFMHFRCKFRHCRSIRRTRFPIREQHFGDLATFTLIFPFYILNVGHISTSGLFDLLTYKVYHTRRPLRR